MKRTLVLILCFALAACSPSAESLATQPVSVEPATTPTGTPETQFFGGGPVFTPDIGLQLEQLAAANLPLPVCDQSVNQSADREQWQSPPAAAIEAAGGDVQNLYSLLRSKLPAGGQIKLCVNSEGWYFRVTTGDGVPAWNQVKGDDGQWGWADHPNQIPVDENGNIKDWRTMRLPGPPASGFTPLVIDGVPVEVQLDRDGRPTAYFNPSTDEWISLKPEPTATPTRTASPTPTIANTPRPTVIPATAVPKPSPTVNLEPEPTTEIIISPQFGEPPKTVGQLKASMIEVGESPFVDNRVIKDANFNIVEDVDIEGERIKLRGGDWIELKGGKTWIVQCRTLERCDPAFDDSRVYHNTFPVKLLLSFIKPGDYYASAIGARPEKLPVLGIMTVATP